ncbi:MAG TPA: tetratricopeptide repeat protein [Thermoanaerobaculia bacterium]|nr:tetratricopeptide repeat protein [Thermoanaerobaculia bacterium]
MRKWFAVLAVVLSLCVSVVAETREEFEARLTRELAAKDPQAVAAWQQANVARDAERNDEAIRLYAQVVARVPSFVHALRRQAGCEMRAGRKQDALAHIRAAVEQERSSQNLSSLAMIIVASEGNATEAAAVAREAIALDPSDEWALHALAGAANSLQDLEMLREATIRLERVAAKSPQTHLLRVTVAVNEGNWDEAQAALDRAKVFGLAPKERSRSCGRCSTTSRRRSARTRWTTCT